MIEATLERYRTFARSLPSHSESAPSKTAVNNWERRFHQAANRLQK